MKILPPVKTLPPIQSPCAPPRADRQPAYLAAKRSPGLWVPVECEGHREALYLANGARRHATLNLEAEQRGNVVFIRYLGRNGFQPVHRPSGDLAAKETMLRVFSPESIAAANEALGRHS
ncbi:MAG: hypothetical protein Q8T13_23785 [Acidobacteriota bacterium]|nr:hypothetical protein [Acidobacteriota bacterium]